ncbi:hypothetical protein SUGI_0618000 [Cryptomeria japonica]|nr:hypothetical protein SUGI_0618000 [Cryptomeria japonica]
MVGHLTTPHCLSFTKEDDMSLQHPHNAPLHIEILIHKTRVKHVLIDSGAGLNICSLSLVRALGYSEDVVDVRKKITTKAYDEEERSSKGIVILPIRVGPLQKDTTCQVLDLDLSYNVFLGRPWIHDLQVVPSTYHHCVKFPYNGQEITIFVDSNPFQYYINLKMTQEVIVPHNREASSLSTQSKEQSFASILSSMEKQMQLRDRGNE